MFPFDRPGPEFLFYYGLFAVAVIAALYLVRRYYESGSPPSLDLKDPLLFACLRGGPKEAVGVATVGLIDRGLLQASGRKVTRSPQASPQLVRRRIEQEVLGHFNQPGDVGEVLKEGSLLRAAAEEYEEPLRRYRLVADLETLIMRAALLLAALAALLGAGGYKLAIAHAAGRSNVGFLIFMMAVAALIAIRLRGPYRTALGDSYLASIRSMFAGLRERATSIQPGSGSRELLWLTALFGAAAVPTTAFPFVQQLWPKPAQGSSGCGSSCGSSCGGSGGCGGGGGGCGGCGS
jgi:uncharacterized protein (TIGR04222 family)